ncbi:MAG: ribonuclease P protein component [Verrucomicrobia bacterium]|nr:ribonuclease P protein component [Verrucomicrobiota bacterium]
MFPKTRRLQRTAEFGAVKTEGKSWTGKHLLLGVLRRADCEPARLGIITTRRLGSAVVRVRVRRRLREIFRRHQHELIQGIWLVVVARTAAATAGYQELEQDWLRLAGRASILAPL